MAGENAQGFWFQMSRRDRQRATPPWGPSDPQELNRYSYVNNNPLRYVDPNGHKKESGSGHHTYYINSKAEATAVMATIAAFINGYGGNIQVGVDNGLVVGGSLAYLILGPDLYRFLIDLLFYLEQYRTGQLDGPNGEPAGPVWIDIYYTVWENNAGKASVTWDISYGSCKTTTECIPNSSDSYAYIHKYKYTEYFVGNIGVGGSLTLGALSEINRVIKSYQ